MSDSVKKKWRLLKKNRFTDLSEQNLRSRSDNNNSKEKEETSNIKSSNEVYLDNEEISPEKSLNHSIEAQLSSSHESSDENLNGEHSQRYSTSPNNNTTNVSIKRYDCDKCNLVRIFSLHLKLETRARCNFLNINEKRNFSIFI